MDQVTSALLQQFILEHNYLNNLRTTEQFEHFCNYTMAETNFRSIDIDLTQMHMGGGGDLGIDGLAIIANDKHIKSVQELERLFEISSNISIHIIACQCKTSNNLDMGEAGKFRDGLKLLFSEESLSRQENDKIKEIKFILEKIWNTPQKLKHNPSISAYYIYTGSYNKPLLLDWQRFESGFKETLQKLSIFNTINFEVIGGTEIQERYRKTNIDLDVTFKMEEFIYLPTTSKTTNAILGYLTYREFEKIIKTSNGTLKDHIFFDNLRDYLGNHGINKEITNSLQESSNQEHFHMMNNGITIIAKSMRETRKTITLTDYQIVNGCQTSHILSSTTETPENLNIPIKIITTEDQDITNAITKATNRQTALKPIELDASLDFQKNIEHFFESQSDSAKLYYERRRCQYRKLIGEEKAKIVKPEQLITALNSFIHEAPHQNISDIISSGKIGDKIFNSEDKMEIYLLCGHLYKTANEFSKSQTPTNKLIKELILIMRHLLERYISTKERPEGQTAPRFNSHTNSRDIQRWSKDAIDIMTNNEESQSILNQALSILNECCETEPQSSSALTSRIISKFTHSQETSA